MRACPLVLLVVAGCTRESPVGVSTASPEEIGARCLDCHEPVVRAYRGTGMARALEPLRAGELDGLAEVADGDTGWSYHFEGERLVERSRGRRTQTLPLAFAIGAGLMDRSYAARVGEMLAFAPLEVVTHGTGRQAALAPGHAIRPGSRFSVPIAEECLACHTDRLPARDYPLDLAPGAEWAPRGISCEACHEGGDEHVRFHESGGTGEDPVHNGRARDPVESLSTCARCHLQGDASFLLDPGARGLPPIGGDLLDRRAVFVAANPTEEIGFVSHVERLVLSRCLTESWRAGSNPLTCTTCHDPHRSVFEAREREVVRSRCGACHTSQVMDCALPSGDRGALDCASCHMRRTGVFDVAGVEIHDHRIERRPPPPSRARELRVKEALDGELALFSWPGRARPVYAEDAGLWAMAQVAMGEPAKAVAFAAKGPGPGSLRLPTFHHLLGTALEATGHPAEARAAYERALELDPAQAGSAVNLGALLAKLGEPRRGIEVLDRVIERHPKAEGALRNRGVLRLQLGDEQGFVADLEAAFAIRPDAAVARALAQHFARGPRADRAAHWREAARRLGP